MIEGTVDTLSIRNQGIKIDGKWYDTPAIATKMSEELIGKRVTYDVNNKLITYIDVIEPTPTTNDKPTTITAVTPNKIIPPPDKDRRISRLAVMNTANTIVENAIKIRGGHFQSLAAEEGELGDLATKLKIVTQMIAEDLERWVYR